ncbi:MAG TPA: hypothetical protein PLR76_06090 [Hyphomonas sp.]|nr:hypothetical protein [Hyphomonas sp.]
MEPSLKPYFDHVWPVFWPWLVWNLIRFARWHLRTGQDALLAVDCFGNIRITRLCDAPQAEDLYIHEAPRVTSWERLAPGFCMPAEMGSDSISDQSGLLRTFPVFIRTVSGLFPDLSPQPRAPP